jgi:GTP pyrophosphokinase
MVSVAQLHPQTSAAPLESLAEGLAPGDRALVARALEFAEPLYAGHVLSTGEPVWPHALGLASSLAGIGVDPTARAAGVLFAAPKYLAAGETLDARFGAEIAALAAGVERLYQLRVLTRATAAQQSEALRKMLLGMVEDVRVVLIRLASRTQTLRWFARQPSAERSAYARETLDIYAPLANRLGVWQLKWELEDLSFRFLEPEVYQRIAKMLDERRVEREQYIAQAMSMLGRELAAAGVAGEVSGRPKHIYSICNKMRLKGVDFEQLHDVRALRVIVPEVQDCFAVLGVVHNLWQPIEREFDDYLPSLSAR